MAGQSYAVIGMGRFGASVAQALYNMGYDVMVIDENEERIQDHINIATHAVQADSTDEQALREVGIRNFDVVVVAIGADIQASILTTLILKEMGVKMIVAKAQNERHGQVLYKVGADRVVFPERDMGLRLAHNLVSPNVLDFVELAEDYSIAEVAAPEKMDGKSLQELDIRAKFGVNVMAIKSGNSFNIAPSASDTIKEGDVLIVIGHNDDLKKFEEES
ncbi:MULTISPECIES: potassium channel family protein [Aneurinibacillus]|jgi:trk system potassium uptake protein TrkA|uniref:TrkA family potassium uptake protein n=1 Tax=Aneurinibacillus thermoaerophilus TaxID=143495 RepID=A0ABX8Y947_ANETH|nr:MULTISPECIES: TrkA family potassium uptake protein [Aneurinibacillus]AMA74600.1 potassium uptake system protein [Aneurinibacillus sp. XH2]MED0677022.1 TrkA family potassium uptake protein [Aneurinibacillus thermoaerophilus]MED0679298.1 TrkA family potassium uptake protein [Aneurinibacillus thermoaerophilus]MED0737184.1 TrkA family potassium uptake protein [Aneurinibacillus thermoaerophilus]MED0757230.1 TrkA family potassium uptake protein [Aneurinibacillus thermoaerophilus]